MYMQVHISGVWMKVHVCVCMYVCGCSGGGGLST